MAAILPSVIPPMMPGLGGPAISFAATRKVLDAARSLGDDLAQKIRTSVQSGLADAAREGIRVETKVLNHIGKQLTTPEQLIEHITSLVQNSLAGNLAQVVTNLEDLTQQEDAFATDRASQPSGTQQVESFVTAPALPQQTTKRAGPQRATVPAAAVRGSPATLGRGTILNQPVVNPQATLCQIPDRATIIQINKDAQDIASLTSDPGGIDQGVAYISFDDQCCVKATRGSPHDLEVTYPVDWKQCMGSYFGIDLGPDCRFVIFVLRGTDKQVAAGTDYIVKQLNPKGIGCGQPTTGGGTDGGGTPCPTNPCVIDVTCPPPVINVPPCPPPLKFDSCIQIDLCNWEKLCETLKNCLKQTSAEDCALDNETAWMYKGCDDSFSKAQYNWWGDALSEVAEPDNYDQLLASASEKVGNFTDADFAPPSPYG